MSPASIGELIAKAVAPGAELARPDPPSIVVEIAVEGRSRLVVTATHAAHRDVAEFLEARIWSPTWLGQDIAAQELAEMLLRGSRSERGWAEIALRSASAELIGAVAAARERMEARPSESAGQRDALRPRQRVRVDLTLLSSDDAFFRDIGVGALWPHPRWQREQVLSQRSFLDDTQVEVLERYLARGERLHAITRTTLWFEDGAGQTMELGQHAVLRCGAIASQNRRYVTLPLGLRIQTDNTITFAPLAPVTMPDRGTLLLAPGDRLSPDGAVESPRQFLLLTAEIEP